MKVFFYSFVLLCLFVSTHYAQDDFSSENEIEIFLIDSYVTPEFPHTFVLSFFTTGPCKSRVKIGSKYEFTVSEEPVEDHKTKINISAYSFDSLYVPFVIYVQDDDDNESISETYELPLPSSYEIKMNDTPGLLTTCCLGGIVFGLPSPTMVVTENKNYFSLTKEIPILTYYSHGYNYPDYYFSVEYSYIFEAQHKNYGRAGIKKIWELEGIEYISPGISYYTNFLGNNGLSPEISIGWFKISTVFTLYSKYRFNWEVTKGASNFHEFSIGLYSSFFSLNI